MRIALNYGVVAQMSVGVVDTWRPLQARGWFTEEESGDEARFQRVLAADHEGVPLMVNGQNSENEPTLRAGAA